MAKKIDRYRQILEADPGSMVFVELAKALIDTASHEEAIEVCRRGLDHHPDSIVGHVLWGRALIGLADPEAAMDHFDQAIALDPNNPYAYNLIGEVLLHRQLHRSAIPILRRAVALQPGDARVRQWLEQAERALSGASPEEAVADPTTVQTTAPGGAIDAAAEAAPAPHPADLPVPASPFDEVAARSTTPVPDDEAATQVSEAYDPDAAPGPGEAPAPPTDPGETVPEGALSTGPESGETDPEGAVPPVFPAFGETEPGLGATDPGLAASEGPDPDATVVPGAPPEDPFVAAGGARAGEDEGGLLPGMTANFEALAQASAADAGRGAAPGAEAAPWTAPASAPSPWEDAPGAEAPPDPAPDPDPTRVDGGPPVPPPLPQRRPAPRDEGPTNLFGLDLPPLPHKEPTPEPKVVVAPMGEQTAQALAAEYERELRAKMMPTDAAPTFWRRYGRWIAVAGAAALAVSAAVVATLYARSANRDEAIRSGLTSARYGMARDSYASYLAALKALDEVLALDPTNLEARALVAETDSVVYAELDHDPDRRARAEKIVSDPKLAAAWPDAILDARYHLAEPKARAKVGEEVLSALAKRPDSATLQYLAGRHLLAEGKAEAATEHFDAALKAEPGHARTVMELAGYLAGQGRFEDALRYYDNARSNFPGHARAQIGAAAMKLALKRDLDGALATVELVEKEQGESLAPEERARLDLVTARLLDAKGDHAAAVARLGAALDREPGRVALAAALAESHLARFELDRALAAADRGLKSAPTQADLLALEAQILVDWGRYDDARERLATGAKDDRRLALLRGQAAYLAGDLKAARAAFDATRNADGKMLADAAIYLALTDVAAGEAARAKAVLDRARKARKGDPLVRWAVGRLELQTEAYRPAVTGLRRLTKSDGRLFRALGDQARAERALGWTDKALGTVGQAVEVNPFYREGLVLLGELHLEKSEPEPARDAFARVLKTRPKDGPANRGMALALLGLGQLDEAETHARTARDADRRAAESHHVLGQVLLAKGQTSKATSVLQRARRLDPESAPILTDLGFAYVARGRRGARQAQRYFEEALEKDRGAARAQWGVGKALLLRKDKDAVRELRRAVGALAKADRPQDRAAAFRDLAEAYLVAAGRPDLRRARQAAWDAVQVEDTAQNRELVATILLEEGKARLARTHLEKALELEPGRASVQYQLGRTLSELEDADAAKAALKRYLDLEPKGAHARDAKKLLASLGT